MIQVIYKGVDVTDDVSINACVHDMYAEGRSDTLRIRFNDTANLWDRWAPQIGDEIRIVYGSISTGTMYVGCIAPSNALIELSAMSAPQSAFCRRYKAWQRVKLSQIAQEVAARHGLTLDNQGIPDHLYSYIMQDGESDFSFLHRRCILEGCAFLAYDGKLVIYDQCKMERQKPAETATLGADGDYRFYDRSWILRGSCKVESGDYSGSFTADAANGNVLLPPFPAAATSNAEAVRFAEGFLRENNKHAYTGHFTGQIIPQYAAASVVQLANTRAPSWDGSVFLTHVRNDYAAGKAKLFFRRPLEGY